MRGRDYEKYLSSPQWQAKREAWFARYGKWCRGCGKNFGPIQLHHLSYSNFRREPPRDLVALCSTCHSEVEKLHYKMGRRTDRRAVYRAFIAANLKSR